MTSPAVSFDRIARAYRWLEYLSFGPYLERCRTTYVEQLPAARHALVLGDGDGRFLARLLAAQPSLTADVVDSSQSMLRLLARRVRRLGARDRVCLHNADALAWNSTQNYDLIVTHFFLDCFLDHQLDDLMDRLLPRTLPDARWVISEFGIPRNPFAAWLARAIVRLLYVAFGVLTGLPVRALPDFRALLLRRGFILIGERQYLAGLLCAQVWSLASLRTDGTHSSVK